MAAVHDNFRVGERWLVQPSLNRIRDGDTTTKIEPKVMDVLLRLAQQPGEVVTRDELLGTVWADTVVSDDVLTRSISELRKAFDDNPRAPDVIETIPKTGYRLIAPVSYEHRGDTSPQSVPAPNVTTSASVQAEDTRGHRFRWGGSIAAFLVIGLAALAWYGSVGLSSRTPPPVLQPTPLTSYQGQERNPALSPDGHQVAFAWNGEDGDRNWDIYVKVVGAESTLRLTDDPVYEDSPTWSPDGRQIAFIRFGDDGCGVFVVSALGGAERKLASCAGTVYPDLAWSPDGQWLALSHRASSDEAFGIYLFTADGSTKRRLTTAPASYWGDHDPSFSPDGFHLAFTRSASEGIQDLYRIPLDGGAEQRLTFDSRNLVGHDWTPDGQHLVFASNRDGDVGLWQVDRDGDVLTRLTNVGTHPIKPDIASNGHLVYQQRVSDTNIWRVSLAEDGTSAEPTRLLASTRWDLHPSISPDGTQIAFTSNRSGSYEVWVSDHDGGNTVRLTDFGGPFTGTPRWSPDGRRLVFDARSEGHADVYVMDAEGGTPRRLTSDPADDLAASWSRDGQWIYFGSGRGGAWQVWKVPAAGGDPVQVTREGGFAAFMSPDGRQLYYTKHNTPGLWRQPTSGGDEEKVLDALRIEDWGNWSVHPDGLYFVQRQPTKIAFYDFATRETTTLFTPEKPIPFLDPAFAVSPDGQWMLIGHVDRSESDLMLVDNL